MHSLIDVITKHSWGEQRMDKWSLRGHQTSSNISSRSWDFCTSVSTWAQLWSRLDYAAMNEEWKENNWCLNSSKESPNSNIRIGPNLTTLDVTESEVEMTVSLHWTPVCYRAAGVQPPKTPVIKPDYSSHAGPIWGHQQSSWVVQPSARSPCCTKR